MKYTAAVITVSDMGSRGDRGSDKGSAMPDMSNMPAGMPNMGG